MKMKTIQASILCFLLFGIGFVLGENDPSLKKTDGAIKEYDDIEFPDDHLSKIILIFLGKHDDAYGLFSLENKSDVVVSIGVDAGFGKVFSPKDGKECYTTNLTAQYEVQEKGGWKRLPLYYDMASNALKIPPGKSIYLLVPISSLKYEYFKDYKMEDVFRLVLGKLRSGPFTQAMTEKPHRVPGERK